MKDFFLTCVNYGVSAKWEYNESAGWYSLYLRKGNYSYSYAISTGDIINLASTISDILLDKLKNFIEVVEDEERAKHRSESDI